MSSAFAIFHAIHMTVELECTFHENFKPALYQIHVCVYVYMANLKVQDTWSLCSENILQTCN